MHFRRLLVCIFLVSLPLTATEVTHPTTRNLHPFSLLGQNLTDSFWGNSTFFHLGAFATTVAMVKTPADRSIQDYFIREKPFGRDYGLAMLRLGDATSAILALGSYAVGSLQGWPTMAASGAAATQAVLINGAYVQILKVTTGRFRPGEFNSADDFFPSWNERVDNFRFRVDYPSGHTSSAFAYVASQHAFFPEHKWIPWVGYPIAASIGVGMVDGRYHWTSDVLAGAIIGTVIGYAVGKNFRTEYEKRKAKMPAEPAAEKQSKLNFLVSPNIGAGNYGMTATWYW